MLLQECAEHVALLEEWLGHIFSLPVDPDRITRFEHHWTAGLETLRKVRNTANLTPLEVRRCLSLIGQLENLKARLDTLLVPKCGGGLRQSTSTSSSSSSNQRVKWVDLDEAFGQRVRTSVITNIQHVDVLSFLIDASSLFSAKIPDIVHQHNALKVNTVLLAKYRKISNDQEVIETKNFATKNAPILSSTNLKTWFSENVKSPLLDKMEEFQDHDSGWTLHSIVNLEVNVNKFNPIRGSSYVELPAPIKNRKACINVQNQDNKCFMWAVLSALQLKHKNANRVSSYENYVHTLRFEGMDFPVILEQIPIFEEKNNISVSVFGLTESVNEEESDDNEGWTVVPLQLSTQRRARHVNLLAVESESGYHYVWIKNLARLCNSQVSKHDHKIYMCERCLHAFHTEDKLRAHEEDCGEMPECKIKIPRDTNLRFKNHRYQLKVPFVIYADLESILKPVQGSNGKTEIHQEHEACMIGYTVKCSYTDELSSYRSEHGPLVTEWFAKELRELAKRLGPILKTVIPMKTLTSEQQQQYAEATICHICEKPFHPTQIRVRDHCHLTGEYRGAAHDSCNLAYQDSRVIPVVFHNLSGYDAHFILRDVCNQFRGKVELLPLNKERYISFTKHVQGSEISFRFIDSFRFMACSLEKLASYLPDHKIVKSFFADIDPELLKLVTEKGVFPYEHLDSWEKLNETCLPPKAKFYSSLYDSTITDEDYARAQKIWSAFNIRNLREYAELYMKVDVLLLADVFESFREQCLRVYKLDPAHYFTSPGLSWDAMLRHTDVTLELLTDPDMILFVERGVRGGISQCSNRYARANNKYMTNYDETKDSRYIVYLDANNLYGWAMTQYLPTGGFEWVDVSEAWDVPDDSPVGYILQVDLEYPQALHDAHNDLPFCPEHSKPAGADSKQVKLLTTLEPKTKYILHYRNLKQALKNGLKLVKIHRILKFDQSAWLKPYIDFNSSMRAEAKNEFEKNFFKLMNNAVFGKTMENVRKHKDVRLLTQWQGRYGLEAMIAKPNFHSRAIFAEDLVAVQLNKTEVLFNKPIYVGFCVLDVSKTLMYDFHYDHMRTKYRVQDCKLLYMDTDSFIYDIKCEDVYEDIKQDIHMYDTANYPVDNVYGIPRLNNKIVGLMKDEVAGKIVLGFVGLRSKMYALEIQGERFIKKAKGIKYNVVERTISFKDYENCLQNRDIINRSQCLIRSKLHNVQTIRQNKIALSPYDDKRYLLTNSTDTLAWGNYRIMDDDDDDVQIIDSDIEIIDCTK